jgi:peroxiredoxin
MHESTAWENERCASQRLHGENPLVPGARLPWDVAMSDRRLSDLMRDYEQARRLTNRLVGGMIPPLLLASPQEDPVDLGSFATSSVVIYLYPGCGSSPDGGEDSPMLDAAQHRAYGAHASDMSALNFVVVGISSQSVEAQYESAEAGRVRHTLLSDPSLLLAEELELPTFEYDEARWYRRLTIVVRNGRIGMVFYPVESVTRNPAQVVAWAKVQGP